MKKYIILLLTAAMFVSFYGCDSEKTVGLDGSVDERVNALIDGYVDDLKAAEHGWMAAIGTSKGYYRFWFNFKDDDIVEMFTDNTAFENQYKTKMQTSTYAFKALQRPTLIFDTYSYVSIINDPTHSISGGSGNNGKGLLTDFEFEVVKYDKAKGVFQMRGRFNKVDAILVKATEEDLAGVRNGDMMSRQKAVALEHYCTYIKASSGPTEIVTKIYDSRYTYQFWYNSSTGEGFSENSYFNVQVDGSGDLSFPEPIDLGHTVLTGLKLDKPENGYSGNYVGFYTESGEIIPATEGLESPAFPIEMVFGHINDNKLFNAAYCPGGLVSNIPAGTTKESLDLMTKFLTSGGGLSLVLAYAQNYYFNVDEDTGRLLFNIYMAPTGLGITVEGGVPTIVTTFPIALYRFLVNEVSDDKMKFSLGGVQFATEGAKGYYEDGGRPLKQLVDLFQYGKFRIEWAGSLMPLNEGLVIKFQKYEVVGGIERDLDFYPPAVLYER